MSETNNKIIGVMSDRREEITKKARGLNGLLLAAAAGAEQGLELDENSIIILADIACEIANSLPCLSPLSNEGQDDLNDVYEKLDVMGRAHLLKYAGNLDEERRKAQC